MAANLSGTTVGLLKTGEHFSIDGHVYRVTGADSHWVHAADGYGQVMPFHPGYEPSGVEDTPAAPTQPAKGMTVHLSAAENKAFEQAAGSAYWTPGVDKPTVTAAINAWVEAGGQGGGDADFTLGRLYHSRANRNGYKNADLDKLLDDAAQATDQNKRKDLYAQANKIIWDDAVGIFPFDLLSNFAYRKTVTGFIPSPGSVYTFFDVAPGR